ncbi:MAG: DUF3644 domain-containing protein [Thalassotalea sp.]
MATNEKQLKFFNFLQTKENSNRIFKINEILSATGWKNSTFKSYLSKGQVSEFISQVSSSEFQASNSLNITFKEFEKKLSQSKHVQALGHNFKSKLAKALLRKSKDNMLLAIELYNRPSLENKIDGFVMLFCTSWEQLLKAIIIKMDGEESIYKKNTHGKKETIPLRACLDIVFKQNDGTKKNIFKIADLRDQAVHLLMPEIQGIASRLFQSGIFNYSSKFEEVCEIPFINTDNTGMISLVGDFKTPPLPMMTSIYGKAADDVISLAKDLTSSVETANDLSFAIPLDVTLQFAKKDTRGTQIVLTKAENGMSGLKDALVIEKSVDAEKTYKFKQNQAISETNQRLHLKYDTEFLKQRINKQRSGEYFLNRNCFQSLIYKLKWKQSNNKYHHYFENANYHAYSEDAIDLIIEKVTSSKTYLTEAKQSYSKRKSK